MDFLDNHEPEMNEDGLSPNPDDALFQEGGPEEELPQNEELSDMQTEHTDAEDGADADEQENIEAERETKKKGRRSRKKTEDAEEQPAVEDFPDDGAADGEEELLDAGGAEPDGEADDLPEGEDEPVDARPAGAMLYDAEGRLIRDRRATVQQDLAALAGARRSRQVLSTSLSGIEPDQDMMPRVIFYVGAVKVIIPFGEMGFNLEENPDPVGARLWVNRLMGARIWYMIRGVDVENRIAVASRRDAMLKRRREILDVRTNSGEFRIQQGQKVTAQVLHVSDTFVELEVYGMVTQVYVNDISNLWVTSVKDEIKVGGELAVELTSLERDDRGRTTSLSVSIRLAEHQVEVESERGQTMIGEINGFSDTAYFVRSAGMPLDVRCPVKNCYTMELMEPGDLVRFYVTGVHDGRTSGAITKVLKKKRENALW